MLFRSDFENPFGSNDYMFETPLASKNYDTMFTSIYTCKDNYPLVYDDTMPPVFDTYCDDKYATDYNHLSSLQLVYHVQVLYDNPTLTVTNKKDFAYVENIGNFMHRDHDKMFHVMVILWILSMMLLEIIMREEDMVSFIPIILFLLSLC